MSIQSLNRREFLRLSLVLTGSALAAACQKAPPTTNPTMTEGTMSPEINSGIQLSGGDADAWTYQKVVKGSLKDPAVCQSVYIDNDRSPVQAVLQENFFSANVPIQPGSNAVTAVCRHSDQQEESSPVVTITGRLVQRPTALIRATLTNGIIILDGEGSLPDELDNLPIQEYFWFPRPGNPATVRVQVTAEQDQKDFRKEISGARIELELPETPVDSEYYFSLRVVDQAGREDSSTTYFVVENGRPRIPDYDHENPAWVEEAIVYGVIPRLFGTPGARAIQEKLDDLADLGINTLWLAPINETNDYGYSVIDYFEVRENFGSKEDFHALIQAAHERGIRILMDFVPNHTSNEHPYFKDTLKMGADSPYWDFYDRDANGNYTYYFDWTHLPNLNYENPEVRRMMIEAFSYWVREFDVDGFRVDACWGVQQRRPDFWLEWRRELKRIKPDLFLLAEASARDPYNFTDGFDAAYDWTEELGRWAWGQFWGEQAPNTEAPTMTRLLKEALTNQPEGYHPDALIFRFLNNNDTGTRFIQTHGEDLTRVATALLLTLPGVPCIYTADEAGQWFRPYFDATSVSFRERYRGLRDYHKQLIALRKEIPSLHSRLWQLLEIEPEIAVLAYLRFSEDNTDPVLVLLNFSREPTSVTLTLPDEFGSLMRASSLTDRLNNEVVPFNARGLIQMDPMSARILTLQKE